MYLCRCSPTRSCHEERTLTPTLLHDDGKRNAETDRPSPAALARRSACALNKTAAIRPIQGKPVHGFKFLLADLATFVANGIQPTDTDAVGSTLVTTPTPLT